MLPLQSPTLVSRVQWVTDIAHCVPIMKITLRTARKDFGATSTHTEMNFMCGSPVEYKWTVVHEKQETKGWDFGIQLKEKPARCSLHPFKEDHEHRISFLQGDSWPRTAKCHARWEWKLVFEALSLEPLVLVTDFLGALQCPLSEGTCHWQQVSVHFDTCHFLNTHFGAGSMTDTIPPLLNWWHFHTGCQRAEDAR